MNVFQGIVLLLSILLAGVIMVTAIAVGHTAKKGLPLIQRRQREHPQKMKISPKSAVCEPGICQCDDALAYHKGSGACNVPGCPCEQFIPSDLDANELKEVANAHVTRLAIESVNIRLDLETRTKALEAATADRELRGELAKRKPLSGGFGVVEDATYETMGGRR